MPSYYDYRHAVTHHVDNVVSFWRLFDKSVVLTHFYVSPKYVDRYLSEFTFWSNHCTTRNAMPDLLIAAV